MKVEERTAAAGAHTPFGLLVSLCCLDDPGGVGWAQLLPRSWNPMGWELPPASMESWTCEC